MLRAFYVILPSPLRRANHGHVRNVCFDETAKMRQKRLSSVGSRGGWFDARDRRPTVGNTVENGYRIETRPRSRETGRPIEQISLIGTVLRYFYELRYWDRYWQEKRRGGKKKRTRNKIVPALFFFFPVKNSLRRRRKYEMKISRDRGGSRYLKILGWRRNSGKGGERKRERILPPPPPVLATIQRGEEVDGSAENQ